MTTTRDEIRAKIGTAATYAEQIQAVAELSDFDRREAQYSKDRADLDWAETAVTATLSPVAVHERSTMETDWLGDVTASSIEEDSPKAVAEAAAWYRRTSEAVKSDREEFGIQAEGMAHRVASQYGEEMEGAKAEFLNYVAFLHQQEFGKEAASGLDQIQQTVNPHEDPKATPLPTETFDNFAPEVHPVNEGVVGTETSERAPLIQEILQEGNGQGQAELPNHHDTAPQPTQGENPADAQRQASYDDRSVAINHTATMADFLPGGQFHEAASGLDQVQQTVDPHEDPAPTPLPEEVAYPWTISEDAQHSKGQANADIEKGAAVQRRAAYVAGLMMREPETLTHNERQEILSFTSAMHKRADMFGQPNTIAQPDVAKTPASTPDPSVGAAEGQADAQAGDAPTFADASSAVPPNVQAYSESYGSAAQEVADSQPKSVPPSLSAAASLQTAAWKHDPQRDGQGCTNCGSFAQVDSDNLCKGCSDEEDAREASQKKSSVTAEKGYTQCPNHADRSYNNSTGDCSCGSNHNRWASSNNPGGKKSSLRVSAAFTSPVDREQKDFAKAYKFASKWDPSKPMVTTGSGAFEAGLYAGISDNAENQAEWTATHARLAAKKPEMAERIAKHHSFTKQASEALEGFRVVGNYLHEAATSTSLDTMGPQTSASPDGQTPINGPGRPGPLAGGQDAAAPGGPSPYNGVEPFGKGVVPNHAAAVTSNGLIDDTPGGPADVAARQRIAPETLAFRKTVQANLLSAKQTGEGA